MNFLGYVIGMLLILAQGPEQEEDGYLEFIRDPEEKERIATAACALPRNDSPGEVCA